MTKEEFWYRWQQGDLSPTEQQIFLVTGMLAERKAQERGFSLMPYPWVTDPPASRRELLIAVGMVHLMFTSHHSNEPTPV